MHAIYVLVIWLSIRINVGLALVSVTFCGFAVTLRFGQGRWWVN